MRPRHGFRYSETGRPALVGGMVHKTALWSLLTFLVHWRKALNLFPDHHLDGAMRVQDEFAHHPVMVGILQLNRLEPVFFEAQ